MEFLQHLQEHSYFFGWGVSNFKLLLANRILDSYFLNFQQESFYLAFELVNSSFGSFFIHPIATVWLEVLV